MDFSVLGPLRIQGDEGEITLRRGLPRALMCFLLLHHRAPVSAEVLADRLWGDQQPVDAANAVHRVVSYVRRTLGAHAALLATQPSGYLLAVDDDALDAARFEGLVTRAGESSTKATAGSARDALRHVEEALTLWRGDPLADVAHYEWAAAPISRLEEMHLRARELRVDSLLTLGRHEDAVGESRALATAFPLREEFHAQLMLALYRSGRQSEALECYSSVRRYLAAELGLDPGPQLQLLERNILAQDDALEWVAPPDLEADPPAVAEKASGLEHLAPPTTLLGRDDALLELSTSLNQARARVLTLTGPGGVGKTRMALELASRVQDKPAWFVDLSVLASESLVPSAVARAVGAVIPPGGNAVEALAGTVKDSPGLLVLDNCEHVVGAVSDLVSTVQRRCTGVVQLATSRRPLRVAGEMTWPVPPLDTPDDRPVTVREASQVAAVRLFEERAASVHPGFVVDDENAEDVAAIVRALDGLPLAIELAAAHADVLTANGIRRRLADHFELLATELRDAAPRQRTLRAVIDSSVELLTDEERRFFFELGAFAGSFDLEAVTAVSATSPNQSFHLIASLVRQSLVTVTGSGQYRLLESLRAYAAEGLSRELPEELVRQRHTDHFLDFMTRADEGLRTPEQQLWLQRVRVSLPDIRSALSWSLNGGAPEHGAMLTAVAAWFWTLEGLLDEAEGWVKLAAMVPVADETVEAGRLHAVGRIAAPRGHLEEAQRACAASAAISRRLGDDRAAAKALVTLGLSQWAMGDLRGAAASHDEAATRAQSAGDTWHHTCALVLRARTALDAGEPDAAQRIKLALTSARSGKEAHLIGLALSQRARHALLTGDPETAFAAAGECLSRWEQVGYREGRINALNLQARASIGLNRPEAAAELARQATLMAAKMGHRGGVCEGAECLASALHASGLDKDAFMLLCVAADERRRSSIPVPAAMAAEVAALTSRVRERLGAESVAIAARADFMTIEDLVEQLRTQVP